MGQIDTSNFGFQAIQWQAAPPATQKPRVSDPVERVKPIKNVVDTLDYADIYEELAATQVPASQKAAKPEARPEKQNLEPAAISESLPLSLSDVQAVARKAGYVGVSEQDIQKAYRLGESLLADYRV